MSDEKIDRIDRRVNELVNIVGNLVAAVSELGVQQKGAAGQMSSLTEQVNALTGQVNALAEQQKITSVQLADMVRVVISLDKKQDAVREEMSENFEKIHSESRILHRKTDWAGATAIDADKRVEELETRVAKLEEKLAA